MAGKRKAFSVNEKVCVIRAIENGEKKSVVARHFGIRPSTIASIWKNKEAILQAELTGGSAKKLRRPKYVDLDQAVLSWFKSARQSNITLSGPIVKTKAEEFAEQMGITDFKASEGWLGKFKHRHNITYDIIIEEEPIDISYVNRNLSADWINNVWPYLIEKYSPNNIFNADEMGLYYKMTPEKSFKFTEEKCVEGKLSKERLTILVAANMSGTEKRKLLVIGKSENPRCFKNIKQLPVTYKSNKSAWMTPQIFEEEIRKWDAELNERKILLLVDHCPTHPFITNLQNIELAFFPANTNSDLQPMEQNLIQSIKSHYRRKLFMELIETDDKTLINILQAVNFLVEAWKEITAETIQQSFRDAGLCSSQIVDNEDNLPLSEWTKQFSIQHNCSQEDLHVYENIDKDLATNGLITDDDIMEHCEIKQELNDDSEDDQSDESEPPTVQQALDAAKVIEKFLLFHDDDATTSQDMHKIFKKIQNKYWQSKKCETKSTNFMYFNE